MVFSALSQTDFGGKFSHAKRERKCRRFLSGSWTLSDTFYSAGSASNKYVVFHLNKNRAFEMRKFIIGWACCRLPRKRRISRYCMQRYRSEKFSLSCSCQQDFIRNCSCLKERGFNSSSCGAEWPERTKEIRFLWVQLMSSAFDSSFSIPVNKCLKGVQNWAAKQTKTIVSLQQGYENYKLKIERIFLYPFFK